MKKFCLLLWISVDDWDIAVDIQAVLWHVLMYVCYDKLLGRCYDMMMMMQCNSNSERAQRATRIAYRLDTSDH